MQRSVAVGLMSQQGFRPVCDYVPSWEKRDHTETCFSVCVFHCWRINTSRRVDPVGVSKFRTGSANLVVEVKSNCMPEECV